MVVAFESLADASGHQPSASVCLTLFDRRTTTAGSYLSNGPERVVLDASDHLVVPRTPAELAVESLRSRGGRVGRQSYPPEQVAAA